MKAGGVCLLIGSLAFATARLLHGDTPAADADAALTFVVERSGYAAVHIVAVLAAATIAIGITALASSLTRPAAWLRNTRLRAWRTGSAIVPATSGLARFVPPDVQQRSGSEWGFLAGTPTGIADTSQDGRIIDPVGEQAGCLGCVAVAEGVSVQMGTHEQLAHSGSCG